MRIGFGFWVLGFRDTDGFPLTSLEVILVECTLKPARIIRAPSSTQPSLTEFSQNSGKDLFRFSGPQPETLDPLLSHAYSFHAGLEGGPSSLGGSAPRRQFYLATSSLLGGALPTEATHEVTRKTWNPQPKRPRLFNPNQEQHYNTRMKHDKLA